MSRRTARKTRPSRKAREAWEAWPPGNPRTNGNKGRSGSTGKCGTTGTKRPPGREGSERRGRKIAFAPWLIKIPLKKTVNEGKTAVLNCKADGNPTPRVTWSKKNSSLPVGRNVVEPSSALIMRNVTKEDAGIYTCSAQNTLGSVNASTQLNVQCKYFQELFFAKNNRKNHTIVLRFYLMICCKFVCVNTTFVDEN